MLTVALAVGANTAIFTLVNADGAGSFSPATFCGALAILVAVILVASWVPLYRATRIDPAEALRNE